MDINSMRKLRDGVMQTSSSLRKRNIGESCTAHVKKEKKDRKKKKAPMREESSSVEKKKATKKEFKVWISDVDEAVDQFIGMPIDVLPTVPWVKWFKEGMSAVVAAKNAVQMYEDIEEDGDDELEDVDGLDESEDEDEEEEDDDDFGESKKPIPYHKWYAILKEELSDRDINIETLKAVSKLSQKNIHQWYAGGHSPEEIAETVADTPVGKKAVELKKSGTVVSRKKKKISESRGKNEGNYVDFFGVKMRTNGTDIILETGESVGSASLETSRVKTGNDSGSSNEMMERLSEEIITGKKTDKKKKTNSVVDVMLSEAVAACTATAQKEKQAKANGDEVFKVKKVKLVHFPGEQTGESNEVHGTGSVAEE